MSFRPTVQAPLLNNTSVSPPCSTMSHQFIFDKPTMIHIASYYVHLHEYTSPRLYAIHTMNSLLNAKYAPPLQSSASQLHLVSDPSSTSPTVFQTPSQNTVIVPVMGKLF
jgi:hypothetical protein